jgi:hypothetical protein
MTSPQQEIYTRLQPNVSFLVVDSPHQLRLKTKQAQDELEYLPIIVQFIQNVCACHKQADNRLYIH